MSLTYRERRHVKMLMRRRDHLKARVASSSKDLTWDKQEIAALDWAIRNLSHGPSLPRD